MLTLLLSFLETVSHGLFSGNMYAIAGTLAAILVVALIFTSRQGTKPPQFHYLVPLLKGQLDLKNKGPIELIKLGYKTKGDCFRMQIFHQGVTVMIGPAASSVFFSAQDSELRQREVYAFTIPVFGKGVVYDAPQKKMTEQLKFVSKGLTGVNMEAHCGKIIEEAEAFFDAWPDQGEVNLMDTLSELTILTACRCLLGDEIRNNLHKEFATLYQELSDGMVHLTYFLPHAPIAAHKKRDAARAKIADIFSKVIDERRRTNAQGHTDFLQVMLDARYKDGSIVTTEEIVGLLLAGLFAGQHTSNITSTWMGMLLMKAGPGMLNRLLEEQAEVLAKSEGKVTLDALNQMTLLHCCMKETLRLYPPLILLLRKVLVNIEYNGYIIPKGDVIVSCPPVSHRLPEVYTNPEAFDPDRFMPGREEDKAQKFSFLSFGGGRHGCLGEKFGFLQTETIWSIMFRTFEFERDETELPPADYTAIVVGPKPDKCRVRFRRKVPRGEKKQ